MVREPPQQLASVSEAGEHVRCHARCHVGCRSAYHVVYHLRPADKLVLFWLPPLRIRGNTANFLNQHPRQGEVTNYITQIILRNEN